MPEDFLHGKRKIENGMISISYAIAGPPGSPP